MIDAGDVHLADLNEERRRRVLVLSSRRFHRLSDRAVVAPEIGGPDAVPFPWRIDVGGVVYAVDLMRSIPVDRLLERVGTAPHDAVVAARRAVAHIT